MKTRKINLDRKPVTTDQIRSRQNFQHLLTNYKTLTSPFWRRPLFYGSVGFASLTATLLIFSLDEENNVAVENNKQKNNKEIVDQALVTNVENDTPVLIAKLSDAQSVSTNSIVNDLHDETKIIAKNEPVKRMVKKNNYLPSVGGVNEGDLSVDDLCNSPMIKIDSGEVVSFKIQIIDGMEDVVYEVKGNKLPDQLVKKVKSGKTGQLIMISDVKAKHHEVEKNIASMNLQIVK